MQKDGVYFVYKRRCVTLRKDHKVVVSFRLDKEDANALERVAKMLNVPRSWIVRKLVKNGLEDLYLGEIAKRRLLKGEWIDFEEMEDPATQKSKTGT